MSKDNFDEYADAKRSGRLKEEKKVDLVDEMLNPTKSTEPIEWRKWIYTALLVGAGIFMGLKGYNYYKSKSIDTAITEGDYTEKTVAEICDDRPAKIEYVDRTVFKWRDKFIFRDCKPEVIYKTDYKCQQDLAFHKLQLYMHYNTPPLKGEWKRVLTFR